jgi:nitric oxide reductase activation protein
MRLYRLGKSLDVELTTSRWGGGKAKKASTTPKAADKRKSATGKSRIDEEEEVEEDEPEESPSKKMKSEKTSSGMVKLEDDSASQNGEGVDEEKAWPCWCLAVTRCREA